MELGSLSPVQDSDRRSTTWSRSEERVFIPLTVRILQQYTSEFGPLLEQAPGEPEEDPQEGGLLPLDPLRL